MLMVATMLAVRYGTRVVRGNQKDTSKRYTRTAVQQQPTIKLQRSPALALLFLSSRSTRTLPSLVSFTFLEQVGIECPACSFLAFYPRVYCQNAYQTIVIMGKLIVVLVVVLVVFVSITEGWMTHMVSQRRRSSTLQMGIGNSFGRVFRISTFGESHGTGVGVIVDGCPPRLPLTTEDIQKELDRRKPGQSRLTTPRDEDDRVEIMSGTYDGLTLGTPIGMMVRNKDQRSKDYDEMAAKYRPSHADATYDAKYGVRAVAGGGRSSARETIGRVAAGIVAVLGFLL